MNIEDYREYCLSYNESPKHWIGINPTTAPDDLLKELTRNSYKVVKAKYTKKKDMKLLFSFLLTVASLSAFAQQTIKISGRVTDFNDKPISNCTVMLMDGRFNAIDSVVTDSVGFYLMNGIKPGKYMALTAIKWDEYVRFSKLPFTNYSKTFCKNSEISVFITTFVVIFKYIYEKSKLYFGSSHVDGVSCGDGSAVIKGVSHKGDFTGIVGKNL